MTDGAILLAAGSSQRFGSDKRRHRLVDGTPLLRASVELYRRAFPRLIVVLRTEDAALADDLQRHVPDNTVQITFCPHAHLGMGHSLAWGARAAAAWRGLFVALADMAWVRPDTLAGLAATLRGAGDDAVVQPVYRGVPGHPVGFGANHLPALAELTGDEGARSVLKHAGANRLRVVVDDPGVLEDLDTPP